MSRHDSSSGSGEASRLLYSEKCHIHDKEFTYVEDGGKTLKIASNRLNKSREGKEGNKLVVASDGKN
jgi:hypothetical protein